MRIALSLLLLFSMLLIGCKTIVLHPIDETEIRKESVAGQNWTCLSDYYIKNVMKVKLEGK